MRLKALTIIAGLALAGLAGCGGNNVTNTGNTGRLAFTIYWQPAARASNSYLVDANVNSVRIILTGGGTTILNTTFTRPTDGSTSTTQTFSNLPPQTVTVAAQTYAASNGTGTPIATTNYDVPVTANTTSSVSIGPGNVVDHIEIVTGSATLTYGNTEPVTVHAFDPTHTTLLLNADALQWQSSATDVVTVTGTATGATLTAVNKGTATITVTDPASGKSGTLLVTVPAGSLNVGVK